MPAITRLFATFALTLALPAQASDFERGPRNTDFPPAFEEQFRAPLLHSGVALKVETLAPGLAHPWGIEVLPDGAGYLVTERPGRLRHVTRDGEISAPIRGLPKIAAERQGGLLDVTLAPDFAQTREIFLTYAKPMANRRYATAAARAVLSEDHMRLTGLRDIFVQTPPSPSPMHYGSRLVFDGDQVFITTGEHSSMAERVLAQDLGTTYGKVVRLNRDGSVPDDNPFVGRDGADPAIWSLGHRNIQGAYNWAGTLWTIEHGPKGGDELNRPVPGKNYGWPVVSYGERYSGQPIGSGQARMDGMEEPVYFWDPVIAPGGIHPVEGEMFADWSGSLLAASLNPGGLVRLEITDGLVTGEERLLNDIGRVRDVEIDDDGAILLLIDARNGAVVRVTPD